MDKQLWPVMGAIGLWHLGYSLYGPFVSLWILRDLGNPTYFELALAIALPGMFSIFGLTFFSKLADNRGNQRELICFSAVIGMVQFILLRIFANSTISFLLIAVPFSMITLVFYSLAISLATSLCSPDNKGFISSLALLFASSGWCLGSLGAGTAFRILGMHTVLLIAGLIIALAGLIVLFSPKGPLINDSPMIDEQQKISNSNKVSLLSMLKRRKIFLLLLISSLAHFGTGALFLFSTIYYVEGIGIIEDHFGYANAAATLIAIPVLLLIGKYLDTKGRKPLLQLALLIHIIWFSFTSITRAPTFSIILWIIPLYAFLSPAITTMMADFTELKERSRGMGLLNAEIMLMPALGAIIGGLLVDTFNSIYILPFFALLFLPLAFILSFFISESREPITPEEVPVEVTIPTQKEIARLQNI